MLTYDFHNHGQPGIAKNQICVIIQWERQTFRAPHPHLGKMDVVVMLSQCSSDGGQVAGIHVATPSCYGDRNPLERRSTFETLWTRNYFWTKRFENGCNWVRPPLEKALAYLSKYMR